jgi:drug/metabolite transporter (DMT)-like permease
LAGEQGWELIGGLYLLVALVGTAVAQVSYKLYVWRSRKLPHLIQALILFALAQVGFFLALTELEVGLVYMSTGLTHLMVMLLSGQVLKERITAHHWAAASLIAVGLVVYAL